MSMIATNPLLPQLDLTPAGIDHLSATLRNRVLHFLLRWESWGETLDCLVVLQTAKRVSFQDMQASALQGLGRVDKAISVLQQRLVQREAVAPRHELARLYLAKGDIDQALTMAQNLVTANADYGPNWSLLGDIHLQRNDLTAAENAFRHHQQLAPGSRQPLIGLTHVHHRRGDSVTAAAYAVRAYTVNEGEFPLSIFFLRDLRDFFAVSRDENRLAAANEQLAQRFAAELAELNAQVAEELGRRLATSSVHRVATSGAQRAADAPDVALSLLPDLCVIPISTAERAPLVTAAQAHFGFTVLRPAQAEIMACTRRGEHVLAVLPTGAGKSLCYQLPALLDEGLTVVVSPLIALMKDQVDNLPPILRQQAIAINSSMDGTDLTRAIHDLAAGRYKIVYVAPERLCQRPFLHALRQRQLARLVIDEAHCVSVWGHDFRPDYLQLAAAHCELGTPPILALTATAPPRVRQDIERQLLGALTGESQAKPMRLIATDIFRPNLYLHVLKLANEDAKLQQLLHSCHTLVGSGIVYVRTRHRCEELAAMLQRHTIQAEAYHAGLPSAEKDAIQDRFMQGATRVIVATIAFGMGIDKADIRFIIHYGLADSVEAYYQEIGRAGRDGQPAHCILLYSTSDKAVLTKLANEGVLDKEFLRALYRALQARLPHAQPGVLPIDDLMHALRCSDETRIRVALSVLEQVGALTRHHEAPRTVTLNRLAAGDDAFADFVRQVRLPQQRAVTRSYEEIAAAAGLPLTTLEEQLLFWQEIGWLRYQASGRDLLLTLPPPPPNISTHLDSLLDQYATIQQQHVTESVDYARHRYCRHGYLANYLGGVARTNCGVCDNCGAPLSIAAAPLPDELGQQRLIVRVLARQGWGRRNLVGLLRGDAELGDRAQSNDAFGLLSFRSENALGKLIDLLIRDGLVAEKILSHGGIVLDVTPRGRRLLHVDETNRRLIAL